jgi:hypothetical protein
MGKVVKKKKAATEAGEPSGVTQKKIEGNGAKAVPERVYQAGTIQQTKRTAEPVQSYS